MANSDVLYKDPIDEVTMAEIRPHIKSAVDEIKDQCDSILEANWHVGRLHGE